LLRSFDIKIYSLLRPLSVVHKGSLNSVTVLYCVTTYALCSSIVFHYVA